MDTRQRPWCLTHKPRAYCKARLVEEALHAAVTVRDQSSAETIMALPALSNLQVRCPQLGRTVMDPEKPSHGAALLTRLHPKPPSQNGCDFSVICLFAFLLSLCPFFLVSFDESGNNPGVFSPVLYCPRAARFYGLQKALASLAKTHSDFDFM